MKNSAMTVVFFDAAGTLFNVKGSVGDIYLRYAKPYGVPTTPEKVQAVNQAFAEAFQKAPPPIFSVTSPEKLKQCERLWWFDLVHAVFYRVGMFEGFDDFFEEVYQAFSQKESWVLYPDTIPALQQLKEAGYELGIISNFDTRLFSILRELGLQTLFDSITISSLAGVAKPGPGIFSYALAQHAVNPEEAIHVGDSVRDDVQGALNARLQGVLLDRQGEQRNALYSTIQTLDDLTRVLECDGFSAGTNR